MNHLYPDNKVNGANMGPTWTLSAPDWPHVGPMNLVIRVRIEVDEEASYRFWFPISFTRTCLPTECPVCYSWINFDQKPKYVKKQSLNYRLRQPVAVKSLHYLYKSSTPQETSCRKAHRTLIYDLDHQMNHRVIKFVLKSFRIYRCFWKPICPVILGKFIPKLSQISSCG